MAELIWLVPLIPFVGFLVNGALSLFSSVRLGPPDPAAAHGASSGHSADATAHSSHGAVHTPEDQHQHGTFRHPAAAIVSFVGPAVVGASFLLTLAIFGALRSAHAETPFVRHLFSWIATGDLRIAAALQVDQLSIVMALVVTGVGFLIHVFSVGYMREDAGYPRYFAYLNLFVAFMLVLVLGASYPVMFVGWEGVGLCSYLLIGYWYDDKANADAGKKAFVMNRIGDFGFLVAMFIIFANAGTLDFASLPATVERLGAGSAVASAAALFFFLACTGKSAQIPLHTWLPDAMAGPTPVSALIHAATMVTAGVYLVARSASLFAATPTASLVVASIGALTAFLAATVGLKQWDIKKVLAFSTVSQLGYMFVGVGVGAYAAGIFHLVTHAFFKALLFLGSGSVIYAMHRAYHATGAHDDAQDMRNMGGLRHYLPVTWALMWIATLAIAGIPPLAGFFSKDEILASAIARTHGSVLAETSLAGVPGYAILYAVYALTLAGALVTAVYMTRMMLYTFHGPNRTGEREQRYLAEAPWVMTVPLAALGVLTLLAGWLNLPQYAEHLGLRPIQALAHWLEPVTGQAASVVTQGGEGHLPLQTELLLVTVAVLVAVAGILLARLKLHPERLVPKRSAVQAERFIERLLENKYYVDELYDRFV
ncbi:MAG TPA: NADH-quinone oxidoreductase subunit L, partial [Gemmatimonadaceae bacterium]|nr:NADH-quinone oxidoreductase subunit L [Gemmatimonadaceae bacterium]